MRRNTRPADLTDIRGHNLGLVLRLLHDTGPLARTELAARSGLAHASLTNLVQDLLARGLITDGGPPVPSDVPRPRGRPRALVQIAPQRAQVLAIQVLADVVTVELVGLDGVPLWTARYRHDATHGDPTPVARITAEALVAAERHARAARGVLVECVIAMAAPVDIRTGSITAALDFGWGHVDLVGLVRAQGGVPDVPVRVVGDGLAAAVAECQVMDPPPRVMLYIKGDTGIGGGLVVEGQAFQGSRGYAGTIGHMSIDWHGRPCVCGNVGCLVTYLGPDALIAGADLQDVARAQGTEIALLQLRSAAERGDPQALECLRLAGEALGSAILMSSDLVNPEVVVLGGYLRELRPWLEPGVVPAVERRPARMRLTEAAIRDGLLAERAALAGAASIALDHVLDDPSTIPLLM